MENGNSVPTSLLSVDLPAILSSASTQELLAKPMLQVLMVEYWCWERGMADWYARQPVRRHRDFAGWIVEGRALFDRLGELKQLARRVEPDGGHLTAGTFQRDDSGSVMREAADYHGRREDWLGIRSDGENTGIESRRCCARRASSRWERN